MSNGLKNLQGAARAAARRERDEVRRDRDRLRVPVRHEVRADDLPAVRRARGRRR